MEKKIEELQAQIELLQSEKKVNKLQYEELQRKKRELEQNFCEAVNTAVSLQALADSLIEERTRTQKTISNMVANTMESK